MDQARGNAGIPFQTTNPVSLSLSLTDFHSYSSPQGSYFHSWLKLDQEDAVKAHQVFKWQPSGDPSPHPCAPPVLSQREPLEEGQLAADGGGVKQPEVGTLQSQAALWNIHLPQVSPWKQQRWFIALGHFWVSDNWGWNGNSSM